MSTPVAAAAGTNDGVEIVTPAGRVKLQVCAERIIRVVVTPEEPLPARPSFAVVDRGTPPAFEAQENGEEVTLATKGLRASVNRKTGTVKFSDPSGKLLLSEAGRTMAPFSAAGESMFKITQRFALQAGESLYGLGNYLGGKLDLRGRRMECIQGNVQDTVPFLISTAGYGILWDNPAAFMFDATDGKIMAFEAQGGDGVDYYFVAGASADDVICGYRALTGAAPLFPKWAYGYFQSRERYVSQKEVLEVARKFRDTGFPIDCIVQDWRYWGEHGFNAMTFDKDRYPDPKGLLKQLHGMDMKMMITAWPKFNKGPKGSEVFDRLTRAHCLFKDEPNFFASGPCYDAFNPEARKIVWACAEKGIFSQGVDAWWLDATEPEANLTEPTAAGNPVRVRNAYPLVAAQTFFDGQRASAPDKRVFILTRSAYAGSQRMAAAYWSGDILSTWEFLREQIPAGLGFCMSGTPYWNDDIGGFWPLQGWKSRPGYLGELYVRWYQFGAFCPIFRSHGTGYPREPWNFSDAECEALLKACNLRYRLLPYIYSAAWAVTNDGYTMMRPLAMDFPDDAPARAVTDQYMFGPAFLVCPVTRPARGEATDEVVPAARLGGGLSGTYYQGANFEKKAHERRDASIEFDWNNKRSPAVPGVDMAAFSARWEGSILTEDAGEYVFILSGDDGLRLWIDGKKVIDDWTARPEMAFAPKGFSASVTLAANAKVPVKIEYFRSRGNAAVELRWVPPRGRPKGEPVLTRDVVLPKAPPWRDFWTGASAPGGKTIAVPTHPDIMPLFVRAGSIVPLGPFLQSSGEKPADPIELRVYRGADGRFTFYEDEGDNYDYQKGVRAVIPISWSEPDQALTIGPREGRFPGMLNERTFHVVWVKESHGTGVEVTGKPDEVVKYRGETVTVRCGK